MTRILCIDTSDAHSFVVLGGETGVLAARDHGRDMDTAVFLPQAIREVLAEAGLTLPDIDLVAVNIGPGGLSATRCGVSFANALAFGLGRPILGLNNLAVLGARARAVTTRPLVCVKRAANAQAYVGLYDGTELSHLMFGPGKATAERGLSLAGAEALLVGDVAALKDPTLAERSVALEAEDSALSPHLVALAAGRMAEAGSDPVEPLNELAPLFTPLERVEAAASQDPE